MSLGRRGGYSVGCVLGLAGGGLGAVALEADAAPLVFAACFLIGTSQGLGQFYRFAATELCDDEKDKASAVALVLAGGIVAAFAGPEAAVAARRVPWLGLRADFSGCFGLVAVANVFNLLLLGTVRFAPVVTAAADDAPRRSIGEVFSQPECVAAVAVATLAHAAMVPRPARLFSTADGGGRRGDAAATRRRTIGTQGWVAASPRRGVGRSGRGGGSRRRRGEASGRSDDRTRRGDAAIWRGGRCNVGEADPATRPGASQVMLMSPLTLAMAADSFPFRTTSTTLELHFFSM